MPRPEISDTTVDALMARFRRELEAEIEKKGRAGWVSSHETLGAVIEEIDELKAAIHDNDLHQAVSELVDVMIAAFWGLASEAEGGWDW